MDEQTREKFTDKVYRTLVMLVSQQEDVIADYELHTRVTPDSKEPA